MLPLLSDENFSGDIVRGLLLRRPDLDLVRVQDVGLQGSDDRAVLAWAAQHGRIVLTHDRATLPEAAYDRIRSGDAMPGVFVASDRLRLGQVIEEVLLIDACSQAGEWASRVLYLPL